VIWIIFCNCIKTCNLKNQSHIHDNKSKICNMFDLKKGCVWIRKRSVRPLDERKGLAAAGREWEAVAARCRDGERKKKSCGVVSEKEERGNVYCVSKNNHVCLFIVVFFISTVGYYFNTCHTSMMVNEVNWAKANEAKMDSNNTCISTSFESNELRQINLTLNIHTNTFWLSLMKLG